MLLLKWVLLFLGILCSAWGSHCVSLGQCSVVRCLLPAFLPPGEFLLCILCVPVRESQYSSLLLPFSSWPPAYLIIVSHIAENFLWAVICIWLIFLVFNVKRIVVWIFLECYTFFMFSHFTTCASIFSYKYFFNNCIFFRAVFFLTNH